MAVALFSRRRFLATLGSAAAAPALFASAADRRAVAVPPPRFATRGVVLTVGDLNTLDWPRRAKDAGLTTIATHIFPHEVAAFVRTDRGQAFLHESARLGLQVEHELHAMNDLVPRSLFDANPDMFPRDERGQRVRDHNLCVHSKQALQVACENAVRYAEILRPTTGRYFYWIDDGQPMCRCRQCRGLSDSDQALILENRVLRALRQVDPHATLAHLAYARTLPAPTQIKPEPGIFLEFAPIQRDSAAPIGRREVRGNGLTHGQLLDHLDANLALFGADGAQILEYWLDVSRFSGWRRENLQRIPWNEAVYRDDLQTYARRGIRHVTTFAAWIDATYLKRFGPPPLEAYGAGMRT